MPEVLNSNSKLKMQKSKLQFKIKNFKILNCHPFDFAQDDPESYRMGHPFDFAQDDPESYRMGHFTF